MAYNRANHLKRVIEVQEEFLELQKRYDCTREIWRKYIYPRWKISERTLYSWLATPAKRDLKKIQEKKENQRKLF